MLSFNLEQLKTLGVGSSENGYLWSMSFDISKVSEAHMAIILLLYAIWKDTPGACRQDGWEVKVSLVG